MCFLLCFLIGVLYRVSPGGLQFKITTRLFHFIHLSSVHTWSFCHSRLVLLELIPWVGSLFKSVGSTQLYRIYLNGVALHFNGMGWNRFQHGNAPVHKVMFIRNRNERTQVSSDLNPTEHIWDELEWKAGNQDTPHLTIVHNLLCVFCWMGQLQKHIPKSCRNRSWIFSQIDWAL